MRGFARRVFKRQGDDPGGDLVSQRRDARAPRLVAQEAFKALLHEPLLPAPHACLRLPRPAHDPVRADPLGAEQNDLGAPDMLLRRVAVLDESGEPPAVGQWKRKAKSQCACARIACPTSTGNPQKDSTVRFYPLVSNCALQREFVAIYAESNRYDVLCRLITDDVIDQVVDCLKRGFPHRPKSYWVSALDKLARRAAIEDYPRYGYALEAKGQIVGVVLLIFSRREGEAGSYIRCNISSWCVDTEYRASGVLLHVTAVKRKEVTYLNISPAVRTRPAIEALGFQRFSNGQIFSAPILSTFQRNVRVRSFTADGPNEASVGKRAQNPGRTCRVWLPCARVREGRRGLSFRLPASGDLVCHPMCASDLLPQHVRIFPFCRPNRATLAVSLGSVLHLDATGPGLGWWVDIFPNATRNTSKARFRLASATFPIPSWRSLAHRRGGWVHAPCGSTQEQLRSWRSNGAVKVWQI